ncbi:hypothetical protein EI171_08480 [Bradyrhizobium sp. LCT2]|uniref:hypothetical protein n=1 Tax=Bradyrhizobium sp. LCT2 TaxID=2493093 RepID=UPI00137405A7|nr:hypothetical protein [Bradyrhizobium sp. LCT2]QHP67458.1 hypothetical protein EI171_08480 [Bradyrhizobium sp. LCT2]
MNFRAASGPPFVFLGVGFRPFGRPLYSFAAMAFLQRFGADLSESMAHTRPTSYIIDRIIDDELVYVHWLITQLGSNNYNFRVPPLLVDRVNGGERFFADEELREAIVHDLEPSSSMDELRDTWGSQSQELFKAFFARMKRHPPYLLKVHVTNYGAGGSYHPTGLPGHPGPFIASRNPKIATSRWTFNQVIVHETIEFLIHNDVRRRKTSREAKEAIVDKFCSCNELQAVYGKYPKQISFAEALPDDWRSYIEWQPGESPNWD